MLKFVALALELESKAMGSCALGLIDSMIVEIIYQLSFELLT